jgi:hypothetical protein
MENNTSSVQPYQHHTNMPAVGINMYSFALKPRSTSLPALATCPALITPLFQLQLAKMSEGSQVSVYATNYNVLRIMSGMGGFAYASCRTFYRLAINFTLPLSLWRGITYHGTQ